MTSSVSFPHAIDQVFERRSHVLNIDFLGTLFYYFSYSLSTYSWHALEVNFRSTFPQTQSI